MWMVFHDDTAETVKRRKSKRKTTDTKSVHMALVPSTRTNVGSVVDGGDMTRPNTRVEVHDRCARSCEDQVLIGIRPIDKRRLSNAANVDRRLALLSGLRCPSDLSRLTL